MGHFFTVLTGHSRVKFNFQRIDTSLKPLFLNGKYRKFTGLVMKCNEHTKVKLLKGASVQEYNHSVS